MQIIKRWLYMDRIQQIPCVLQRFLRKSSRLHWLIIGKSSANGWFFQKQISSVRFEFWDIIDDLREFIAPLIYTFWFESMHPRQIVD